MSLLGHSLRSGGLEREERHSRGFLQSIRTLPGRYVIPCHDIDPIFKSCLSASIVIQRAPATPTKNAPASAENVKLISARGLPALAHVARST